MLHGCETWCIGQSDIWILQGTERSMVRSMRGIKLMDKISTKSIMQMSSLNETKDQMAKANSIRWYKHALKNYISNSMRRALDFNE